MSDEEIAKIREALATADHALVAALEARVKAVQAYATLKQGSSDVYGTLPSTDEVVRAALEQAERFPHDPLERALREVLGACDAMVAPVKVSFVGPEGGFGWLVAEHHFGSTAQLLPVDDVGAVFDDVARGRASFGVVAFETSSDGAVTETLEQLVRGDVRIGGEISLACSYDLVSATGNVGDIGKVYATAQALVACERTLKQSLPRAALLEVQSGRVAEELAREDHGAGAVAVGWSEQDDRGLRRVAQRVEDRPGLQTRFVVVGHDRPARTGADRTLVALACGEQPGSLHAALRPFAEREINLTRIESRPSRDSGARYLFILELDGHVTDRPVMTAIEEVRAVTRSLKILGSFPRPA